MHCDGARMWEVAAKTGRPLQESCEVSRAAGGSVRTTLANNEKPKMLCRASAKSRLGKPVFKYAHVARLARLLCDRLQRGSTSACSTPAASPERTSSSLSARPCPPSRAWPSDARQLHRPSKQRPIASRRRSPLCSQAQLTSSLLLLSSLFYPSGSASSMTISLIKGHGDAAALQCRAIARLAADVGHHRAATDPRQSITFVRQSQIRTTLVRSVQARASRLSQNYGRISTSLESWRRLARWRRQAQARSSRLGA